MRGGRGGAGTGRGRDRVALGMAVGGALATFAALWGASVGVPTAGAPTVGTATAGVDRVTVGRDTALQPFSDAAPANTPFGAGVQFEAASSTRTAALLRGSAAINSAGWSIAVAIATASDPWVTLTDLSTGVALRVRMPSDAQAAEGLDGSLTVVQPDGHTAYDCYKMVQDSPFAWTARYVATSDLRGDGLTGGTRASGVSQLMGLIRTGEVAAAHIPHGLALAIPGPLLASGPVPPARWQDGNAATTYTGPIAMGTRVGIPPSVDLTALALSPEGLALGRALQDYGAYVLDRSANVALYAEPAADQQSVARMRADFQRTLFRLLRVVSPADGANSATRSG